MTRIGIVALTTVLVAGAAVGAVSHFASGLRNTADVAPTPVWIETAWPFPIDPWGKGKAFDCRAEHCGTDVRLYVRTKIGSCGCVAAIDDDDLDRVGDVDLIGAQRSVLEPGRPIEVRWAKGRIRAYAVSGRGTATSVLSIALHERCDMVVATALVRDARSAAQERTVIQFLNSDTILSWAEAALGL
jgi:hypothetical protein